jgi:phosphoheptose isomerase
MVDKMKVKNNIVDPRGFNQLPKIKNPVDYLKFYADSLYTGLMSVDKNELEKAFKLLEKTMRLKKRVYVAGNGGSAAIGEHLCCDWMKGTYVENKFSLSVVSLTANSSLLTAISNDFGYEHSFSFQLKTLAQKDDVLVLISSSGNSKNIIEALKLAKKTGMKVIGLSGFSGGMLKKHADISLYVPIYNYGLVEDAHQALMHILTQVVNLNYDSIKK